MKVMVVILGFFLLACRNSHSRFSITRADSAADGDTILLTDPGSVDSALDVKDVQAEVRAIDSVTTTSPNGGNAIHTAGVDREALMRFAESLVGTPYVYGSTDPRVGFDCSGFITYVFNHFNIKVPRSSHEFANVGQTIPVDQARRADIILFTDPDDNNSITNHIGHMGLVTANENGAVSFIHSTSGKAMAVAISPMSEHYKKRFVRVARIFP